MEINKAMQIIRDVTGLVSVNRADHLLIEEALSKIELKIKEQDSPSKKKTS